MPLKTMLKELRKKNDLTQEHLAIKLNIGTRTYNTYETGNSRPSVELLTRIAKLYKIKFTLKFDENGEIHCSYESK